MAVSSYPGIFCMIPNSLLLWPAEMPMHSHVVSIWQALYRMVSLPRAKSLMLYVHWEVFCDYFNFIFIKIIWSWTLGPRSNLAAILFRWPDTSSNTVRTWFATSRCLLLVQAMRWTEGHAGEGKCLQT
jgi:hypothetical protein